MNYYTFKELYIGLQEAFQHVLSEEDMMRFFEITNDINPLHKDDIVAQKNGYKSRVVYGMLTASLISTLGGVYLPGEKCLIQSVETKFLRPVYVGDSLSITGTVKELNESVQQAIIKVIIKNQNDAKVLRGKMCVGFLK